MTENCFILQIVITVSDARDNALAIFNAIFPSRQERRSSYKSCFSCYFHQSLSKTTKAAVIKPNVALVTLPSQQNVTKLEVQQWAVMMDMKDTARPFHSGKRNV